MTTVSVRDLRNDAGEVLDRVVRGETLIVTRDGAEVAQLRPLRRRALPAAELIARRAHLIPVEPDRLRKDIDDFFDPTV